MTILAANHLSKSYGKRPVVKDVSFSVSQGEVVGLLGPNGAGKTTLFASIAGFLKPDGGDVQLNGRSILNLKPHKSAREAWCERFKLPSHSRR